MTDSDESPEEQIKRLKAELEAEKAKAKKGLYLKVSAKGAASLYGIRRFPVTFYLDEWIRILDMEDDIRQFLADNDEGLSRRG